MIATVSPPDETPAFTVDIGSLAGLRQEVSRQARRNGNTGTPAQDLVLIANEWATNVIRHGGGRGVMWLWRHGTALYCRATDRGRGMPDPQNAGSTAADPDATTGRGLWLIRQLSQRVHITSGPSGTTVTVAVAC
jgi:anti-sigma regulatory factor (Ser/Thr protein kinase)